VFFVFFVVLRVFVVAVIAGELFHKVRYTARPALRIMVRF